jgi:hypothetical protein
MQPVFLANCHEERFGFDPWVQSIRFHSAVQEQKQWNVELPFQDASSRLIHQVCMNRRLLSSSETVFFLGLGSWVTISQDFLFSVAVLQLGRVWLSARRAIPSFPSMHLPRVSHSVISTETSVQVGAIKWCSSSGCRSLNLWLAESNPHCNQLDDQMFHRLVWFVTGGSWVRNHSISKGRSGQRSTLNHLRSCLAVVLYMQIWRILKCLSSLDLPWQLLQGVSRWIWDYNLAKANQKTVKSFVLLQQSNYDLCDRRSLFILCIWR